MGEARMYYVRKELRMDSGGPGRNRGGLGQEVEFGILDGGGELSRDVESSVRLSGRTENGAFPVFGRRDGRNGRGSGMWLNGEPVDHGVYRRLVPGDRVRFVLSGGGGYGDPNEREPDRVLADVEQGYVSLERAEADYGVVIDPERMLVDAAATAELRRGSS